MPETYHKGKRNGSRKYLLPIAIIIITLIAIVGRFACALERARNTPTADIAAYSETVVLTEEPSEEPVAIPAIPEAPAAPTVNVQILSW